MQLRPWVEYGVESILRIDYTPAENLFGPDRIRFTYRDTPEAPLTPLLASTAPFEVRFNLIPVNDVPVAVSQTLFVDGETGRQGLPLRAALQYYDVETVQANLTVGFAGLSYFFNGTANETYSISTGSGRVTFFLPNSSDTASTMYFVYQPAGAYQSSDTFRFVVSDGNDTSLQGAVTLVYAQAATGEKFCKIFFF